MEKRKQRSEEKGDKVPENTGELRSTVADAKAFAAQDVTEVIGSRRKSSGGNKPVLLSAPAVKPRPKSFAGPETKPRSDSVTERKSSRGVSFDSEFIPPPPVLDAEDQPRRGEGSPRVRVCCMLGFETTDNKTPLLFHRKNVVYIAEIQSEIGKHCPIAQW